MGARVLPFTFTLRAAMVVPSRRSRPEHVETLDAVPGPAMRGAVLTALSHHPVVGQGLVDRLLAEARFLPATPSLDGARSLPTPVSMRSPREDPAKMGDLLSVAGENDGARFDRPPPASWLGGVASNRRADPTTTTQIHIQRAEDRRLGRPTEDSGALFSYAAIDAGTAYHGVIVGDEPLLHEVSTHLEGRTLRIGTATSTGYGGLGVVRCGAIQDREVSTALTMRADLGVDARIGILVTSDAVVRNSAGADDPLALAGTVAERFASIGVPLRCVVQAVRPTVVGGYASLSRRELPQRRAAAAGSIVQATIAAPLAVEHIAELELQGLGALRRLGYGTFVLLNADHLANLSQAAEPHADPPPPPAADAEVPPLVVELDERILRRRRQVIAAAVAHDLLKDKPLTVTRSLLGRLRARARGTHRDQLLHALELEVESFRDKAKQPLEKQQVGSSTLWKVLTEDNMDGQLTDARLAKARADLLTSRLIGDHEPVTAQTAVAALGPEVVIAAVEALGTRLGLANRHAAPTDDAGVDEEEPDDA